MERIDGQNREFTNITERITKNINDNIDEKFLRFEQNYRELEEKINKQQASIKYFERYIKRRNLIFFGVEEKEESYFELEEIIHKIINQTMQINCEKTYIEYVGRLGRDQNNKRPVIVTFTTMGKKLELLTKKKNLKNTNYSIQEDFTKDIVEKDGNWLRN